MLNLFKKKPYQKAPQDWDKAKAKTVGYDKVKITPLKIGAKPYPLILNLLKIAREKDNKLKVLDFGGGFGNVYFKTKEYLPEIDFTWHIVEQKNIIESAFVHLKEKIKNTAGLYYYLTTPSEKYDIILLSGVLQCLKNWQETLDNFIKIKADYIIIDRTLIYASSKNKYPKIIIQNNPDDSSYPCWILNEKQLINSFDSEGYRLEDNWHSVSQKKGGIRTIMMGGVWKMEKTPIPH